MFNPLHITANQNVSVLALNRHINASFHLNLKKVKDKKINKKIKINTCSRGRRRPDSDALLQSKRLQEAAVCFSGM